jgi:hypothetical protein
MTGINVAVSANYSRAGGTCTATLAPSNSCTILIVFSPTTTGSHPGTVTITTTNGTITGSPVALTGTGQ